MEPTMEVGSEGAGFAYARGKKKKKRLRELTAAFHYLKGIWGIQQNQAHLRGAQ